MSAPVGLVKAPTDAGAVTTLPTGGIRYTAPTVLGPVIEYRDTQRLRNADPTLPAWEHVWRRVLVRSVTVGPYRSSLWLSGYRLSTRDGKPFPERTRIVHLHESDLRHVRPAPDLDPKWAVPAPDPEAVRRLWLVSPSRVRRGATILVHLAPQDEPRFAGETAPDRPARRALCGSSPGSGFTTGVYRPEVTCERCIALRRPDDVVEGITRGLLA